MHIKYVIHDPMAKNLNLISHVLFICIYKDLAGIYSAREFVWWYNGHPDSNKLAPDVKSTDTVVVLGQVPLCLNHVRIHFFQKFSIQFFSLFFSLRQSVVPLFQFFVLFSFFSFFYCSQPHYLYFLLFGEAQV